MKTWMRSLLPMSTVLLSLLSGCATAPPKVVETKATPVPHPASTPFDSDPEQRAAYLRGYSQGYLQGQTGKMTITHYREGHVPTPEEQGWDRGNFDACTKAWRLSVGK